MKKYRYEYNTDPVTLPPLLENDLFIDIETTGFQRTSTFLTIIGLAWMEDGRIIIEQWFNETGQQEEPMMLLKLQQFLKQWHKFHFSNLSVGNEIYEKKPLSKYPRLVHYNGTTFDLPYLKSKYEQYHLPTSIDDCQSYDLYHLAKKYRQFLSLPGLRQKNLEEAFGLFREDKLSGQELIHVYLEGIRRKDKQLIDAYLLHNKEDMEGMVFLRHLVRLDQLFHGGFSITNWEETEEKNMVTIHLSGDFFFFHPVSLSYSNIHFTFETNRVTLFLPIRYMQARYFYENYKDYYYLPAEDCAMHKSVAEYVEKEYRKKATKETCYTKKTASFLPLPLPSAARQKKECIKECCLLNLFYECYGDCTAWIIKDLADDHLKSLYLQQLLKNLIFEMK